MFKAPIPGQSLTTTPKNAPYERPPQIADPRKALAKHLDHLSDSKRMDSIMQLLEKGVPISTLTEGVLRSAVAEGIHSVDVSLIIAPVLHEYIKGYAVDAGVEFTEGFEEEDLEERQIKAGKMNALKVLKKSGSKKNKDSVADVVIPEETPEVPVEQEEAPKRGLVARRK